MRRAIIRGKEISEGEKERRKRNGPCRGCEHQRWSEIRLSVALSWSYYTTEVLAVLPNMSSQVM